ncbi:MAG: YARHG domain-containing protein [Hyphomicrobiaceae bacterium]|nr:MAG: YARHG domain-containing protein [Hyphomicrobiaceae bacterium]
MALTLAALALAGSEALAQSRSVKNCYEVIGCPWKFNLKAEDLEKLSRQNFAFIRNRIYFENGLCFRSAKAHGFRTAFINRRQRPFGQSPRQPDLVVADFAALATAIG